MSKNIPQVQQPSIRHAEFVKLTVTNPATSVTTSYFWTNSPVAVANGSDTYVPTTGLLSISEVQNDLKTTGFNLAINVSGIPAGNNNEGVALLDYIKGSPVVLSRGFIDSNNVYQFSQKFSGIVTQALIKNDLDFENDNNTVSVTFMCSSIREVLAARIAGVKTNTSSWQSFYTGDTSMDRVAAIAGTAFDFGTKPKDTATTSNTTGAVAPNNNDYISGSEGGI